MTAPKNDYPVPTNDAQIAALEKALATAKRAKLEPVISFLDSPELAAIKERVAELVALNLPAGTSAAAHINQLPNFLAAMDRGARADAANLDGLINPPPAVGPEGQALDGAGGPPQV